MDMYSQIQLQNDQMMMYQAMQLQQQAYMYGSFPQAQVQYEQEPKEHKKQGKRSYNQCELWKRQALIEKVDKEGLTIKDAAKELEINYSTAKHIMKVYRQTGEVETKIMMKRKTKETYSPQSYSDWNMEVAPQAELQTYQQVQPCYYDMGASQCQLPIDENMQDVSFQPTQFEEGERRDVHNFLFSSQSGFQ